MGAMREMAVNMVRPIIADGAELGVRLYRVISDKFGEPQTLSGLVYIFNEYPEELVHDAVLRMIEIGAIVVIDDAYAPAPDATG